MSERLPPGEYRISVDGRCLSLTNYRGDLCNMTFDVTRTIPNPSGGISLQMCYKDEECTAENMSLVGKNDPITVGDTISSHASGFKWTLGRSPEIPEVYDSLELYYLKAYPTENLTFIRGYVSSDNDFIPTYLTEGISFQKGTNGRYFIADEKNQVGFNFIGNALERQTLKDASENASFEVRVSGVTPFPEINEGLFGVGFSSKDGLLIPTPGSRIRIAKDVVFVYDYELSSYVYLLPPEGDGIARTSNNVPLEPIRVSQKDNLYRIESKGRYLRGDDPFLWVTSPSEGMFESVLPMNPLPDQAYRMDGKEWMLSNGQLSRYTERYSYERLIPVSENERVKLQKCLYNCDDLGRTFALDGRGSKANVFDLSTGLCFNSFDRPTPCNFPLSIEPAYPKALENERNVYRSCIPGSNQDVQLCSSPTEQVGAVICNRDDPLRTGNYDLRNFQGCMSGRNEVYVRDEIPVATNVTVTVGYLPSGAPNHEYLVNSRPVKEGLFLIKNGEPDRIIDKVINTPSGTRIQTKPAFDPSDKVGKSAKYEGFSLYTKSWKMNSSLCDKDWCPWNKAHPEGMVEYCSSIDQFGHPRLNTDVNCREWCAKVDFKGDCGIAAERFCEANPQSTACTCMQIQKTPQFKEDVKKFEVDGSLIVPPPVCWAEKCTLTEGPDEAVLSAKNIMNKESCRGLNFTFCEQIVNLIGKGKTELNNTTFSQICGKEAVERIRPVEVPDTPEKPTPEKPGTPNASKSRQKVFFGLTVLIIVGILVYLMIRQRRK